MVRLLRLDLHTMVRLHTSGPPGTACTGRPYYRSCPFRPKGGRLFILLYQFDGLICICVYHGQAICKLPFIVESRLLAEIAKVEHTLTGDEKQRNSSALDALYVHTSHPLASKIFSFYRRKKEHPKFRKARIKRKLDPKFSGGVNGYMYVSEKTFSSEVCSPIEDMETIESNQSIFVYYKPPPSQTHIPSLPKGVILPRKSISKGDVRRVQVLWHEATHEHARSRRRPVSMSLSGPRHSKAAHQLVSNCTGKRNDHDNGIGKRKFRAHDPKVVKRRRTSKYKKRRN